MRAPYSRTMFDLLCEQAERYPDRVAVISNDTRVTYSQLHDGAARVAAGLRSLGLGRHDRIGLLLNNRTEWLEICFAAAAIGRSLLLRRVAATVEVKTPVQTVHADFPHTASQGALGVRHYAASGYRIVPRRR